MENIILLVVGVALIVIGIINITGNISTIHKYNRRKVKEEDIPKYGKMLGSGTLFIGLGIIVKCVLDLLNLSTIGLWVMISLLLLGLIFMLFAQFKYNKGIF